MLKRRQFSIPKRASAGIGNATALLHTSTRAGVGFRQSHPAAMKRSDITGPRWILPGSRQARLKKCATYTVSILKL
jgi:hypothetical protein